MHIVAEFVLAEIAEKWYPILLLPPPFVSGREDRIFLLMRELIEHCPAFVVDFALVLAAISLVVVLFAFHERQKLEGHGTKQQETQSQMRKECQKNSNK